MLAKIYRFFINCLSRSISNESSETFRILELKPRQNLDDLHALKKLRI